MPRRILGVLATPLRLLWRVTGKPVYERLFGMQFRATINRLNSVLGQLSDIRAELDEARGELVELREFQEQLDGHVRNVVARHWDMTALTRRLATIEDRISAPELHRDGVSLNHESADRGGDAPPATTEPNQR